MLPDGSLSHARIPGAATETLPALNRRIAEVWDEADAVVLEGPEPVGDAAVRELLRVAALSPQHGIVVPAVVAGRHRDSHVIVLPDRLPAVLRTSFLRLCGGLDEGLQTLAIALADFALRANEIGASTVVADGTAEHVPLTPPASTHEQLLRRHEHLGEQLALWDELAITPQERFQALLVPERQAVRRILLDVTGLDPIPNGSARSALAVLEHLATALPGHGFDAHVLADPETSAYFELPRFQLPVHDPASHDEVYDLAVAISPVVTIAQADRLNRLAMRWITLHLDVIALRMLALRSVQPERLDTALQALRHADRVITISEASARDVASLYGRSGELLLDVQHQGLSASPLTVRRSEKDIANLPPRTQAAIEKGGFVLVVGNHLPHKQVIRAVRALADGGRTVLAMVELPEDLRDLPQLHGVASGTLSDELVAELYERAEVVVFPSAYEGFGLPIVEAAAVGRPVVALRTQTAVEVVAAFGLEDLVSWFESFDALGNAVDARAASGGSGPRAVPDMTAFAAAIEAQIVDQLAQAPQVSERLERRWDYYRSLRSARRPLLDEVRWGAQRAADLERRAEETRRALGERIAQSAADDVRRRDEIARLNAQLSAVMSSRAYRFARRLGDVKARLTRRTRE